MATRTDTLGDFGFLIFDFGFQTARDVAARFGTTDVREIARFCGLKIEYGRWAAVTAGEFEPQNKLIRVNQNAVEQIGIAQEKIIAHELGHFFARNLSLSKAEEEKFCDEFAEELLKL
jgi:Zn-dependent membrane protease YugP